MRNNVIKSVIYELSPQTYKSAFDKSAQRKDFDKVRLAGDRLRKYIWDTYGDKVFYGGFGWKVPMKLSKVDLDSGVAFFEVEQNDAFRNWFKRTDMNRKGYDVNEYNKIAFILKDGKPVWKFLRWTGENRQDEINNNIPLDKREIDSIVELLELIKR